MSDRAYARRYHEVMDDPKFDGIREDVRLFGSWALLLLVADMSYPAPAFVPPTVPRSALRRLIEAELVDELPGHRFRIHGLEAERMRRTVSARAGGLASGRSRSVERPLNDRSLGERTETNLAEQSRAEQSRAEQNAHDPADTYWSLTGRYPTDRTLGWIDDLARQYGAPAVDMALGATHEQDPTTSTLLGRVTDRLKRDARKLDLEERAAEEARIAEKRRSLTPLRAAPADVSPEEAARIADEYRSKHRTGDAA